MPRGIHSVKDAARSLGISESHCRRLLENGKIQGTKLGHDWVVRVLKYKRKRKPKRTAGVKES
jgi:excisionase family DNA binding protein